MVDFQTLTLFSLTLLTAAMFIFYYLLVTRVRHTSHATRKIPRTPIEHPTSVSRTKTEHPSTTPVQIPNQAPIQIKPPLDIPIQNQSQISRQIPVQIVPQTPVQTPVQTPPENVLNVQAKVPILRGEAATEALKKFADELEKAEDTSAEKTRNASMIKLARVLIDVIQADKNPEKTSKTPDQNKREIEEEKKITTRPSRKHDHSHEHARSEEKKKTKIHQPSRARKTNRKTKNKERRGKSRQHGTLTKKHSVQRAPKKRKSRKTGAPSSSRNRRVRE